MYSKQKRRFKSKRVQHDYRKKSIKRYIIIIIEIKTGIMINVDASAKRIIYVKKAIFRILLHVVAKLEYIYQVLLTIQ